MREHGVCQICGNELVEGQDLKPCPSCDTLHHSDCWDFAGGCSTFGCVSSPDPVEDPGPLVLTGESDPISESRSHREPGLPRPEVCPEPATRSFDPVVDTMLRGAGSLLIALLTGIITVMIALPLGIDTLIGMASTVGGAIVLALLVFYYTWTHAPRVKPYELSAPLFADDPSRRRSRKRRRKNR